jgi:cysteine desulfurase / selenocysteine lyase
MSAEITPDLVSEVARRLFQRDIYPLGAVLSQTGTIPVGPVGPTSINPSELSGVGQPAVTSAGLASPDFGTATPVSPTSLPTGVPALGAIPVGLPPVKGPVPPVPASLPQAPLAPFSASGVPLPSPRMPTAPSTAPDAPASATRLGATVIPGTSTSPGSVAPPSTGRGDVPAIPGGMRPPAASSSSSSGAVGQGGPVPSGIFAALARGLTEAPVPLRTAPTPSTGLPFDSKPSTETIQSDGLKRFVSHVRSGHVGSESDLGEHDPRLGPVRAALTAAAGTYASRSFDVASIRRDFPVLKQTINGRPLAWFDNAATTQKPQAVIDAISRFYERDNSNIHRGAHTLAARATEAYESARGKVQRFIGAGSPDEIVFVRGTTEGINLVARVLAPVCLKEGDEIVLTTLEHHANIVPWQMVARETGAKLRVAPVNDAGEIIQSEYAALLGPRTRVVALAQANNSLGTVLPVAEMTQLAKRFGARVVIDGAQSVSHMPVNVRELGCDFFVFSGHKLFGPTGIGAVYINPELHDVLPPWQGGGNMIRDVTFEETTFQDAPARFEAGTPNIADAIGLGAAIDYVSRIGLPAIGRYEHELLEHATAELSRIDGLRILGTAREKVSLVSFTLAGRKPEEVGKQLDREGIAVRSGHHCAQPSLRRFGEEASVRPSFAFYNTHEEIDRLVAAVRRIRGG